MIPKIDLNTTQNDPRPQMIPKFFHTRPRGIIGMEWDDVFKISEDARITSLCTAAPSLKKIGKERL